MGRKISSFRTIQLIFVQAGNDAVVKWAGADRQQFLLEDKNQTSHGTK